MQKTRLELPVNKSEVSAWLARWIDARYGGRPLQYAVSWHKYGVTVKDILFQQRAIEVRLLEHDDLTDCEVICEANEYTGDYHLLLTELPQMTPNLPAPSTVHANVFQTSARLLSQAEQPQPRDEYAPIVPSRKADLRKWKATWTKIKPLVAEAWDYDRIDNWLEEHDDHLRYADDTITKIIAAGEAGLLD